MENHAQRINWLESTNLTVQGKLDWLYERIREESAKSVEEMDADWVWACSEKANELEDHREDIPQETLAHMARAVMAENGKEAATVVSKATVRTAPRRRRRVLRWLAAAAAIAVLTFGGLTVAARSQGYESAWAYVKACFGEIWSMKPGETRYVESHRITVIKPTGCVSYGSMEELLTEEKLDVMYPAVLPEGCRVERVYYTEIDAERYSMSFHCSVESLGMIISNYQTTDISEWDILEVVTVNDITFRITVQDNGLYYAVAYQEGLEYRISYESYDDLMMILNGLKETKT